jgi:hypothetical protein
MIELKINSIPLEMYPGISVSLEDNNPMFSDEVIPGTFSLPFDLPATSHNQRILSFPELIQLATKPTLKYKNVEIWIHGIPWRRGELIFRGFSNKKYRVNFQVNTSTLGDEIKNLKIRELNHQKKTIVNWIAIEDTNSGPFSGFFPNGEFDVKWRKYIEFQTVNPDNTPIVVNVNGQTFTTENGNLQQQVNAANLGLTLEFFNEAIIGSNIILLFRANEFTDLRPEFNISVSGGVVGGGSWQIRKYYLDKYIAQSAIDYTNVSSDDCVFPSCQVDYFYDSSSGIFNVKNSGSYLTHYERVVEGQTLRDEFSFIPMYFLKYVFAKITEKTGLKFSGEFIASELYNKLVFYNTHSLDYFEETPTGKKRLLMDAIYPADHLPDLSVSELLLELKKLINVGWDYNKEDNLLDMFFLKNQIDSQNYEESSSKFNPDYDIEYNNADGIKLFYDWDEKDAYSKKLNGTDYDAYKSGLGEKEIISKIFTAVMESRPRPAYTAKYKIPVASQKGSWFGEKSDGKARLLFWHGNSPDSLGFNYPFASSDNYTQTGVRKGDYTLKWKGIDGLYNKFWKGWAEFLINDIPSKRVGYWSIVDLLNFNYKKKYRIDGVLYFIRKLSFTVTDRINPAEIELMKAE